VAAHVCLREALDAGASEAEIGEDLREVEAVLGESLDAFKALQPSS